MMKLKKRRFNHKFYKTFVFWFGVILAPEIIKNLFFNHDYSFSNWGTLVVIILAFFDSFFKKENS